MTRSLRAILAGCFITAMMVSTSVPAQQVLPTPLSLFVTLVLSPDANGQPGEIQWDAIPFPENYRVYYAYEWPLGIGPDGKQRTIETIRVLIAGPNAAPPAPAPSQASLPAFRFVPPSK